MTAVRGVSDHRLMPRQEIRFALSISREDYLRYYQGLACQVLVRSHDGRHIQFPARFLRPFVSNQGIRGEFCLLIDEANRMLDLQCLSSPGSSR